MGLLDKLKEGLKKTAQQLTANLTPLFTGGTLLSPETLREMEEGLVMADIGAATAQQIVKEVQERLRTGDGAVPVLLLREAVSKRLLKAYKPLDLPKPVVILLAGVNGAGKTTTTGKLAARFSIEGRKVLLAAADTFRAAAEEQLTEWAGRAKVEIVRGSHGAAPSAVVFDAIRSGLAQGADLLLIDTAGRLHNRQNLMEELKKMVRVSEKAAPGVAQEKWLVLDANTGQNALNQAREFNRDLGLTGLVLTKLDGTAKGGVVVALCEELGLPIRYLGVGEGLDDLVPYDPRLFAEALVPDPAVKTR